MTSGLEQNATIRPLQDAITAHVRDGNVVAREGFTQPHVP